MTVAELKLEGLETVAFTETQLKMLDVLRDGELHHISELHACLPDDLGAMSNVYPHVSTIREKIRAAGYLITNKPLNRSGTFYILSKSIKSCS